MEYESLWKKRILTRRKARAKASERARQAVIGVHIFISLFNTKHIHFEHMRIFEGCLGETVPMLRLFSTNSFARLHIHNLFISMLFLLLFFYFSFPLTHHPPILLLRRHLCFMFSYRLIYIIQGTPISFNLHHFRWMFFECFRVMIWTSFKFIQR